MVEFLGLSGDKIKQLVNTADEESLRELFENFYSRTYAAVMAVLRDSQASEDVTQEAFVKAFQKLGTLREPSRFGAWLTAIATNLARDRWKKEKKYLWTGELEGGTGSEDREGQAAAALFSNPASCRASNATPSSSTDLTSGSTLLSSVEAEVFRKEEAEMVRQALRNLPPEHYQVVILYYYHQLRVDEISEYCGIRKGTVKSRLFRARQRLLETLPSRAELEGTDLGENSESSEQK